MMFKISCMVEDKNLPKTLRALAASSAYDVMPVPVANAEVSGGKVKSNGANATELLSNHLRSSKTKTITIGDVKDFLKSHGFKPSGAGRVIRELVKSKRLKRSAHGIYGVLK